MTQAGTNSLPTLEARLAKRFTHITEDGTIYSIETSYDWNEENASYQLSKSDGSFKCFWIVDGETQTFPDQETWKSPDHLYELVKAARAYGKNIIPEYNYYASEYVMDEEEAILIKVGSVQIVITISEIEMLTGRKTLIENYNKRHLFDVYDYIGSSISLKNYINERISHTLRYMAQ